MYSPRDLLSIQFYLSDSITAEPPGIQPSIPYFGTKQGLGRFPEQG